ncbi:ParB/RepB/Spo0J family partition protein [Paracoccus sp. T5]|uniref:ParB/RepB/Spo0J family partition protein n=1 Tax=Paracoccus sp. T5 TaxID=3402161 RepID=UPI003AE26B0B
MESKMKDFQDLDLTAAAVSHFALDMLYVSPLNPRQDVNSEGIDMLAQSIASVGLIQSLAGHLDNDGRVGIVGGGRRLRAIKLALERDPEAGTRHPELVEIPVRVTTSRDVAIAWASVENVAREALDPADEIRAFAQLRDTGATVGEVARTFGVTEQHVYRRMALADLPSEVLDALKARQISLNTAAVFTLAKDKTLALEVLDHVRGRDTTPHYLRSMLLPDAIKATDSRVKFVGLDAYEAAGGTLTRDLFSEDVALHDEDVLNHLYTEKVQAEAQAYAQGWKWFEVLESSYASYQLTEKMQRVYKVEGDLSEEEAERYDELAQLAESEALDEAGQAEFDSLQGKLNGDYSDAQRQIAGLFIFVSNGVLSASGPWIRKEDQKVAVETGVLTGHAASTVTRQADMADAPAARYSNSLLADLHTLQLHAVQGALARDLDLQLDLLAFQLSTEGYGSIFDIAPTQAKIVPEKADGLTPDPILEGAEKSSRWLAEAERVEAFEAFRAKGKKHRDQVLAVGLARLMPHRSNELFGKVADLSGADLRAVWTPTKTDFFGRMKSDHLDELLMELTGLGRDDKRVQTFCNQKKSGKAEGLEDLFADEKVQAIWGLDEEGRKRIAAWVPDCL